MNAEGGGKQVAILTDRLRGMSLQIAKALLVLEHTEFL
jgi:hypothetical protein